MAVLFGAQGGEAPKGLMKGLERSPNTVGIGDKRSAPEAHRPVKRHVVNDAPSAPPPSSASTESTSADELAKLSSLLFRKKSKSRPGSGRVGA